MVEYGVDIPVRARRELLRQKLELWRNTCFDAELDAKVADAIGDDGLKEQGMARLKQALKAVGALEAMLKEEGEYEQAGDPLSAPDR